MKKTTYYYLLFGHCISSELELPEAMPWPDASAKKVDIAILLKPIPDRVLKVIKEEESFLGVIDETDYWFASNGGHYYITEGNQIIVDQRSAEDDVATHIFLLGTAMGLALIQRGLMPVHGSSLIRNGKAVIVGGNSGAGKSTVSESLLRLNGMRYLADDVSVLSIQEDGIVVFPAYPQRKLCRNTAMDMNYTLSDLVPISQERDKFAIRSKGDWCSHPAPLGAIVEIVPMDDAKEVRIEQIQGHDSLTFVIQNLYRNFVHVMQGMRPESMKKCLVIASSIPLYRLYRPTDGDFVDEMVKCIEKFL